MFKWLFSRHKHEFLPWEITKRLGNDTGAYVLLQERKCKTCGFVQINRQEVS